MEQAQAVSPAEKWGTVSLTLTDDAGITAANRAYFGKDSPTDVISCAYDPLPGEAGLRAGEVIVNVQRAREEGARRDGMDLELALYIAHGCQHLAGRDDAVPAARAAMRRCENAWLRRAQRLGLIGGLTEKDK
ncbi:MAG TPA: rRNA maturation RNase YbeY [Kiritimatiellia bacterium]|nr:rRNA maturation RNase YbeY [Kiritimatiellia bacterium]